MQLNKFKKTIAIMQPTYLPWLGYFDLMDRVDYFVFLDSVQFSKRSWQQRNRIKTSKGELILTVPVLAKGKYKQKINQVRINQSEDFVNKHLKALEYNYSKARLFKKYFSHILEILEKKHAFLADLNIDLILWLKKTIGIKTRLIRSSSLKVKGRAAELLVNICKALETRHYLSPVGAKTYIKDGQIFKKNSIQLSYQQYKHPVYKQLFGKFADHLSVIDLLFNEGNNSLEIIRSGRKNE